MIPKIEIQMDKKLYNYKWLCFILVVGLLGMNESLITSNNLIHFRRFRHLYMVSATVTGSFEAFPAFPAIRFVCPALLQ